MARSGTIDKFRRKTARRLRQNATDSETRLWRQLRRFEMKGTHFRRQMPIGRFVVDFACPAAHLVVEVDGSHHGDDSTRASDEQRTRWLESEGYQVLRFWNNDVTQNLRGVLQKIYATLYGSTGTDARELKHTRRRRPGVLTPPRRATRADPPPAGEGE